MTGEQAFKLKSAILILSFAFDNPAYGKKHVASRPLVDHDLASTNERKFAMSLTTAMWVPGTAARVEYPERLTWRPPLPAPAGFPPNPPLREIGINGANIFFSQQNQSGAVNSNWFHFPIPTPVILDNIRAQLLQVFVLYQTQVSRITSLHVWDGPNLIMEQNNLSLVGDHLAAIDASNTFVFNPLLSVFWGINISVQAEFLPESPTQPMFRSLVAFSTAGADFITP